MNALSRFVADAYLATQSTAVKDVVLGIENAWNITLDEMRYPATNKAITARTALVCALGNLGLPLRKICEISHMDMPETLEILEARRDYGVPIRTTRWGAVA
jgi:hypothetical protein